MAAEDDDLAFGFREILVGRTVHIAPAQRAADAQLRAPGADEVAQSTLRVVVTVLLAPRWTRGVVHLGRSRPWWSLRRPGPPPSAPARFRCRHAAIVHPAALRRPEWRAAIGQARVSLQDLTAPGGRACHEPAASSPSSQSPHSLRA